ncbi:MAG: hypothetical protein DRR19_14155 [Candidatus Parabeggiatoa sp. nov. 1]|nr:MAG: hypothetical protein DRR19_14155 [Gammaproteobacteria bacterium]
MQTGTFAETDGNAGNICLNANELIIDKGTIISSTLGNRRGGNIDIFSTDVKMNDGSIKARSIGGLGDAGSISLTAKTISLNDLSIISTSATQTGGGNIEVQVHDHLHLFDSGITARTQGNQPHHSGGNLTIRKPQLLTLNNSQLLANAYAGNGGNISIIAGHFIQSSDSLLSASSELGIDGNITIDSSIEDFSDIQVLPSKFGDKPKLLNNRCAIRSRQGFSTFRITTRDVLPVSPEDLR